MNDSNLVGNLLIAHPNNPDDSLAQSVIMIVSDNQRVVLGLQINNQMEEFDMVGLGDQLGLYFEDNQPIYFGGRAGSNKIHVLHSNDWSGITTVELNSDINLTNDISVLTALSMNEGPELYRACAGFWLWEHKLLINQLNYNKNKTKYRWEMTAANLDLIFNSGHGTQQWSKVLEDSITKTVSLYF